jgi:hypothetical protein
LPPVLDIDGEVDAFGTLLGTFTSKPVIHEHDMQRLRHAFYSHGVIDRRLAAEIFHANRNMRARHDGWTEFYLEALTDVFLDCHQGQYLLPAASESVLLAWLGDGVSIADPGERRLALRILLRANNGPERLEQRVVHAIEKNMLHESERWLEGGKRSAGIIDALDIHLIQRLLRGCGGPHPRKIRRAAITFLLNLNRHAQRFVDPDGWWRLLVGSLVRHLCAELPLGPAARTDPRVDIVAGLTTLLDCRESPTNAARLRHDVLAAAQVMLHAGDGPLGRKRDVRHPRSGHAV